MLAPMIVGGLLLVFSMWWIYFDRPVHDLLVGGLRKAIVWGYGHYFVFASAAAVGAGLAVSVDAATHHAAIGTTGAGFAVAIPTVIFIACLWILHDRPEYRSTRWMAPLAAPIMLLAPFTTQPVLVIGSTLAGLVGIKGWLRLQARRIAVEPSTRARH
jgi:low temperature requirement protein LtrA